MNNREISILRILMNSKNAISGLFLSKEIGCSTKTIQNDIKNINNELEKAKIISIKGIGYKLEGEVNKLDFADDFYLYNNRINEIIKILINNNIKNEIIKLDDLADKLYVSLSTIKNDLKEVKDIFSKNKIQIKTKHKKGIYILGNEEDIIIFIINLTNNENNINVNDFLSEFVKSNYFEIRKYILTYLQEKNIILTDNEFKSINDYINIYLSKNNVYYKNFISIHLDNYINKRNKILNDKENSKKIINSIKEFTNNLKIVTGIDITNDSIFEEFLYNHIYNIYKKYKLNIYSQKNNIEYIKIKYPYAYDLAKIAKKTIESNLDININENEIANIAIHVGGAIERINVTNTKKTFKTIIVCTSGIGTSMLLKAKIENIFKDKIEVIKIIPYYLSDYINLLDIDFILTTVPISIEDIDVINISPIISDKEIKIINKYIETQKIYPDIKLKDLFEKDLFFNGINFNNKSDIINFMSEKLYDKNYIDKNMKLGYIEREKIASTEIGNLVSIPHNISGVCYENKIAVSILKTPIKWDIGEVRLVVMIAIDKDSVLDYEELFLELYKRIDSLSKVINICESNSFENFIKFFE